MSLLPTELASMEHRLHRNCPRNHFLYTTAFRSPFQDPVPGGRVDSMYEHRHFTIHTKGRFNVLNTPLVSYWNKLRVRRLNDCSFKTTEYYYWLLLPFLFRVVYGRNWITTIIPTFTASTFTEVGSFCGSLLY